MIALVFHENSYSYEPLYTEGSDAFAQIVRIAAISPWAFIGFENISHFSEEYRFPVKKVRGILIWSVIVTTLLYLFVSLLSVSAYPPEYDSWLAYIRDMGKLEGIKAVPAFYAAEHYMGRKGVTVRMVSLLGVILTSLIGNMLALSRLLYAAGREEEAPQKLARLNARGIPDRAIFAIVAVSVLIPFLGRTAIGWIVDVTTLSATLIYGMISHAVYRHAKAFGLRREMGTGVAGMALMVCFVLLLLIPGLLPYDAMATESYFLFIVWAVLGLGYFRWLVRRDQSRRYRQHVVVWIILLMLVLFSSMMWVSRATENAANEAIEQIYQYHQSHPEVDSDESAMLYSVVSLGLFFLSTSIMLNNYQDARKLSQRLSTAEKSAVTDALTGVKNRTSYIQYKREFDERIAANAMVPFSVMVCDINDLKTVNDTLGHDKGDECIKSSCMMVCKTFKQSPVFRIGGDEFALFLRGADYVNRDALLRSLEAQMDTTRPSGSLAVGVSDYVPGKDRSILDVFTRADHLMYQQKKALKAEQGRKPR